MIRIAYTLKESEAAFLASLGCPQSIGTVASPRSVVHQACARRVVLSEGASMKTGQDDVRESPSIAKDETIQKRRLTTVLEHLESQAVIKEIDDSSDKEEFVEYRAIKSL